MKEAVESTLQQIDLDRLRESKSNPRGTFDKATLAELTESVRTHGVLQAILVRPIGADGEFEIVAGARRFRAARAAKRETIPAQVRVLSDDQVLELQLIENLQRQDMHPLDEANSYKRLVNLGHTVEDLAARVGKSASYIYQRLKMAELISDAQAAFREARISAAHAIQIARLQPAEQGRVLDWCLRSDFRNARQRKQARKVNEAGRSVKNVAEFIQREIHLDLASAPFPVADALLVEKAGACTTCPKRTGANPGLFADIAKDDTCTDPACYHGKVAALVQLKTRELRPASGPTPDLLADGYNDRTAIGKREAVTPEHYAIVEKKSEACPFTRDAILATGPRAGQVVSACTDRKCKTHFDKDGRRRYPGDRSATTPDAKKQDGILKLARTVRSRVLDGILKAAPKKLGREELNLLALALFEHLPGNFQEIIAKGRKWKQPENRWEQGGEPAYQRIRKLPDAEFARFAVELMALPQSHVDPHEARGKNAPGPPFILALLAKRAKVNIAQVERGARKETKAKKAKGRELHTNAKAVKARTKTLHKAIRHHQAAPAKGGSRGKAKAKK